MIIPVKVVLLAIFFQKAYNNSKQTDKNKHHTDLVDLLPGQTQAQVV